MNKMNYEKKKCESGAEDKELFHNLVKDVKPIQQDKYISPSQRTHLRIHRKITEQSLNHSRYMGEILLEKLSSDEWLTPENFIQFRQSAIPRRTLKQLKNGEIPIDAKLDLHGYTADKAIDELTQYLSNNHASRARMLLIIHGKSCPVGQHGPILKNIVYQWLKTQPHVLFIYSAHARHGGNGAVYVGLRR